MNCPLKVSLALPSLFQIQRQNESLPWRKIISSAHRRDPDAGDMINELVTSSLASFIDLYVLFTVEFAHGCCMQ